jgi:hypothetical protein
VSLEADRKIYRKSGLPLGISLNIV